MNTEEIYSKANNIKLAIFDVDGVLTDGQLYLGENGNEYKSFHVHDGLGLVLLLKNGFDVAVITARNSNIVSSRMQALGIKYLYQGQDNKETALLELKTKLKLDTEQICYTGDDLIDLPAMKHVGLKIAVNNAHSAVKDYSDWTTSKNGGYGAAREVAELLLTANGKMSNIVEQYLK